jgi:hypothetical protein
MAQMLWKFIIVLKETFASGYILDLGICCDPFL